MALNNLDLLRYARDAIRNNLPRNEEVGDAVERVSNAADSVTFAQTAESPEEKLHRFCQLIRVVDEKMDQSAVMMEEIGIPEGVAKHHLLRDIRVVEQSKVLQCVNSDQKMQTEVLNPAQLYDRYLECKIPDNYMAAQAQVKECTDLTPCERIVDGVSYVLYGDPELERTRLIGRQGASRYAMCGTCGLCSAGNVLTMAGAEHAGEEDIIGLAFHASEQLIRLMDLFNPDTALRGGTTSGGRRELLAMRGIDSDLLPMDVNRNRTMRELAQLVKKGHGVILSVEVARLWKTQKGGHAITLVAVSEDEKTFFYCDTGIGCLKSISAKELGYCLNGSPCNVTKSPIR